MMRMADVAGSFATGTLQIGEFAVNEMLATLAPSAAITLLPENRVRFQYGPIHAHMEVPHAVETGASPHVTVRLSSVAVAFLMKAVVRQPFVHIRGRDVTVFLADIPALRPYREWWRCVHEMTLRTSPQALRVGFHIAVPRPSAAV
jgi:hypothetical protein